MCLLLTLSLCLTGSFSVYAEDLTEDEGLVEDYSVLDEATVSTSDDSIIAEGSFENISLVLDSEYTLTVSGNGEIPYISGSNSYYLKSWQSYRKSIKFLVVEEGITVIGDSSFCDCINCTSVSFPETLIGIDYGALCGCTSLKSITFPHSLAYIEWNAFRNAGLTAVTIPGNVKSIGMYAFSFCENLETVTILEGTTTINENAFSDDSKLTIVYLPGSIVKIYPNAFAHDPALAIVYYNGTQEEFLKIDMSLVENGVSTHRNHIYNSFMDSYQYYFGEYDDDYYVEFSAEGIVVTTPVKFVFKDGSVASRKENVNVKTTSSNDATSSTKTSDTSVKNRSIESEGDIISDGSPETNDSTIYSYYVVMMGTALIGLLLLRTRKEY